MMSDFRKAIESMSQKHNIVQLFDDFMEMCICVLAVGMMEEQYEKISSKYLPEEVGKMAHAFGYLLNEYTEITEKGVWGDVLGDFFMQTNSGRAASKNGQFFTPIHICTMMAKMINDVSMGAINDPSCGSGRNLIAHAHAHFHTPGEKERLYIGMDLDKRCVNMTALNMAIYGMNGLVVHMDSIAYEVFGGYRIYPPNTEMGIQLLSKEECDGYLFEVKNRKH
jgi:type I restriction enzyme M protein